MSTPSNFSSPENENTPDDGYFSGYKPDFTQPEVRQPENPPYQEYPQYNQTYPAPPYKQPDGFYENGAPYYAPQTSNNLIAILALVFSFIFAPAGLILGLLGLKQSKENNDNNGRILSIAATVISGIQVAIFFLFILLFFVSASVY